MAASNKVKLTHTGRQPDNFTIDYSDHQIWDTTESLPSDEITLTFQKPYGGARWRTPRQYNEGTFSAQIRMCSGATDGIVGTFYLSSLTGGDKMDQIEFMFMGKDKTRVRTKFWVNGKAGSEQFLPLGFDASAGFHSYTIDYHKDKITWLVDSKPIRVEVESESNPLPQKPLYLYSSVWDGSGISKGKWAGVCSWKDSPYYFRLKQVTVPVKVADQCPFKPEAYEGELVKKAGGHMLLTHKGREAVNFVIDYSPMEVWDVTESLPEDEITIRVEEKRAGCRFRTQRHYTEGRFSAKIKICSGETNGIVSGFYTSSEEGNKDKDEIDFEFLGKDKTRVQTNYYVDGQGGHEQSNALGFDASKDFHLYTLDIQKEGITWLVDGNVIREEKRTKDNKLPIKPFYLYCVAWNASDVLGGRWAGRATFKDAPYYLKFKQISVPKKVCKACPYKPEAYTCNCK